MLMFSSTYVPVRIYTLTSVLHMTLQLVSDPLSLKLLHYSSKCHSVIVIVTHKDYEITEITTGHW
jgi:hypothetical protein